MTCGFLLIYLTTMIRHIAACHVITSYFRLEQDAEDAGAQPILSKYMENGTQKKVWEHTLDVFDKVLAR